MQILTNMCRICENQSIFIDLSHPDHQSYLQKFLSCANVTFQIDDALPKYLCRLCTTKLEHSHRFKQKCEETQKKFEKLAYENDSKLDLNLIENVVIDTKHFDDFFDENTNDEKSVKSEENVDNDFPILTYNVVEETRLNNKMASQKNKDRSKRKKRTFICDICRTRSLTKKGIEQHMQRTHDMAQNLRECPYCGKYFTGRKYLLHVSIHEKPNKCELCGLVFSFISNLKRHISGVHEKIKNFQCHMCNAAYAQKSSLDQHIDLKHLKTIKYECDKCDKKYYTKYTFDQHTIKYHLSAEEKESMKLKSFQCKICQKKHKSEADLEYHESRKLCKISTNIQNAKYVCQWCGKICNTYGNYYAHEKLHKNDRSYKCNDCNKTFNSASSLCLHKRTHTGHKPYKCTECDMSFAQNPHLKTHMKTHTGERPYECEFCGKTFAFKHNCMVHRRLHTGEKPHRCAQCTESFIDLNGLKRHRKKYHHE